MSLQAEAIFNLKFYLNKLILKSIYPFGVIRTKTNFYPKTKIIVYPKKIKPTDLLLSEFAISKNIRLGDIRLNYSDSMLEDDSPFGKSLSKRPINYWVLKKEQAKKKC